MRRVHRLQCAGHSVAADVGANSTLESAPRDDVADTADSIYRNGGSRSLLHPVKSGSGYLASMVMGVHTG